MSSLRVSFFVRCHMLALISKYTFRKQNILRDISRFNCFGIITTEWSFPGFPSTLLLRCRSLYILSNLSHDLTTRENDLFDAFKFYKILSILALWNREVTTSFREYMFQYSLHLNVFWTIVYIIYILLCTRIFWGQIVKTLQNFVNNGVSRSITMRYISYLSRIFYINYFIIQWSSNFLRGQMNRLGWGWRPQGRISGLERWHSGRNLYLWGPETVSTANGSWGNNFS